MSKHLKYHHWVEWSGDDNAFIGFCPDLFIGGVCHGADETKVYGRLVKLIHEEITDLVANKKRLPRATVRPIQELIAC